MSNTSNALFSAPLMRTSFRSLFGRGRVALLIIVPLLMIALAALLNQADAPPEGTRDFLTTFGFGILAPIIVLICTSTLINSEFDDGSILYLLIKPVSRLSIVASKTVIVLLGVVLSVVLPITVAAALVDGGDNFLLGALVGGAVTGVAYTGIFIVLATVLKRSILGCIGYWLVWEYILVPLVTPARWLSAKAWGIGALESISSLPDDGKPPVPLWYAVSAALVVLLVGVWVAARRLRSVTLSDD